MKHQRRGLWWILSVCTLFLVRPHVHQGLLGNIEESRGGKLEELCNEFKWSKYFQSNSVWYALTKEGKEWCVTME
ncbi:unnamed protein product [Lactuca virosa]|uniref:Uncharacterized protein n=1 Tax=Lactuca virosa TaxID=75947 RepID=A0AAU9LT22_9ASTR|nr:unnamed protein product [Lactuca virosa]